MKGHLTTLLDVAGAVLLVAALAILAGGLEVTFWVRCLGVAGVGLLVVSWVADGAPIPKRKDRS